MAFPSFLARCDNILRMHLLFRRLWHSYERWSNSWIMVRRTYCLRSMCYRGQLVNPSQVPHPWWIQHCFYCFDDNSFLLNIVPNERVLILSLSWSYIRKHVWLAKHLVKSNICDSVCVSLRNKLFCNQQCSLHKLRC